MADFNFTNDTDDKVPANAQVDDEIVFTERSDEANDFPAAEDGAVPKGVDGNGEVPSRRAKIFSDIFDCVETFCYALVLMVVLFLFVFRYVSVDGTSMFQTLKDLFSLKDIRKKILYTFKSILQKYF